MNSEREPSFENEQDFRYLQIVGGVMKKLQFRRAISVTEYSQGIAVGVSLAWTEWEDVRTEKEAEGERGFGI